MAKRAPVFGGDSLDGEVPGDVLPLPVWSRRERIPCCQVDVQDRFTVRARTRAEALAKTRPGYRFLSAPFAVPDTDLTDWVFKREMDL